MSATEAFAGPADAEVATTHGIVKHFGSVRALDGVDLAVSRGAITGLVGPDGAGKTTLIRVLAGLIQPDAGEAQVLGRAALRADRARIGYMPQRFGLYEDLSVIENLDLHAELHGVDAETRTDVFGQLLEFTDLKRFQKRLAGALSGGMKQKLGLACALVSRPDLLLLDEPGVGVDPVSRRELWDMVRVLGGSGTGILWSTAYLDEAEACDRTCLLNEGKVLHFGPPQEVVALAAGRVIELAVPATMRRSLLTKLRNQTAVLDGTIRGERLRLLLRNPLPAVRSDQFGAGVGPVLPEQPAFEDGFVALLGGLRPEESSLAASYRTIPPSEAPMIEAWGLTKRYGDFTAAQDIDFAVRRGEIFGLLGPNGAGKSTTFKMLCGLITATAGRGAVAGFDLRRSRAEARQSLGYMAQKFSLYGDLSVAQNLTFFAGIYGLSGDARAQAIEDMTRIFHLGDVLGQNAGGLPLGIRQRLSLACAVMHQPPVLFLDEPTSGVDPLVRREFWNHITGLVDKGVTVLVTTHFMEEAEYCNRIALIHRSRQIARGTPAELKARAGGVSSMNEAFAALIAEADKAEAA